MAIQTVDKRGTIIYKSSQICAYADDLAIITRTEAELKKIYKQLEKETKKLGLYVNIIKTKYMFITSKDNKKKVVNMRIGTKEFEGVSIFKYLGLLIDNQNSMTNTIKEKIQMANKAYYANIQLLKNKTINRRTKMKLYKTLIRPIATYDSEVWTLTKENDLSLRIFERKIIRKIYGSIKMNEEWKILTNEEIENILENENIVRFIKIHRLRWLGHVIRMGEDRLPKRILQEKIFSSRRRGRPKLRWLDDVKKDLHIMKVIKWEEKARNREEWRRIVEEAKAHSGV
jgi:hypothetical protein